MLRAAILGVFALADCTPTEQLAANALPSIQDRSSLRITLFRTGCYGTCPMYGVEIDGSGTAVYCGQHFVKDVGQRTRQVADADLARLVEQFHAATFMTLNDEYAASVTDNPTYIVSISYDGKSKVVRDYVGESAGMPASVTALEDAIDAIAGTAEWIGDRDNTSLEHLGSIPDCARELGVEPPEPMPPPPL